MQCIEIAQQGIRLGIHKRLGRRKVTELKQGNEVSLNRPGPLGRTQLQGQQVQALRNHKVMGLQARQRADKILKAINIIRAHRKPLPIAGHGAIMGTKRSMTQAHIIEGVNIVRGLRQSELIGLNRLRQEPLLPQHIRQAERCLVKSR